MLKDFAKDYAGLCKVTGEFYKKHWLGVTLLNVAGIGTTAVILGKGDKVKNSLKKKFKKHKEEA